MEQKKCQMCGKLFAPTMGNQKYCNKECVRQALLMQRKKWRDKVRARPQYKKCENCGENYKPKFKGERFCTDKCRLKFFKLL